MRAESLENLHNDTATPLRLARCARRAAGGARIMWLARSRPPGADGVRPWAEGGENYWADDRGKTLFLNCKFLGKDLRGGESRYGARRPHQLTERQWRWIASWVLQPTE